MIELTQLKERVRLDFDYYGLIGDLNIFKALKIANFFRIADGFILGNFIEGGYILPIKDVELMTDFLSTETD